MRRAGTARTALGGDGVLFGAGGVRGGGLSVRFSQAYHPPSTDPQHGIGYLWNSAVWRHLDGCQFCLPVGPTPNTRTLAPACGATVLRESQNLF